MNCFNHPIEIAVGTCQDCNKGLCPNCAKKFQITICSGCNNLRIENEKANIITELLTIFFIGWALYFFNNKIDKDQISFTLSHKIGLFYGFCSLVAGWKYLNKLTPQMFLFLPIVGWVIYFITKLLISAMIGIFVLPFKTFRNIKRYLELKKI